MANQGNSNEAALSSLVRMGTVSSVDVAKGTARVSFGDRGSMVSGNLKILKTQPVITVQASKAGGSYSVTATYASADRGLGKGEGYDKNTPDNIDVIGTCNYAGETKNEEMKFEVHPWMPYIGQQVVCIYPAASNSDGFIVGGL